MSDWSELVSVALLGTERRQPPALGDAELAALAGHGGAEERLLASAGALILYRRAGREAPGAPGLREPAPEDPRPICGPAAAARLAALLADRPSLVAEWLGALAASGRVAPAERLPDLLELGSANAALRPLVEPVLGERGRWLAAQEPAWLWAGALPAGEEERERLWATGERPQRRRLFAAIRSATPAQARDLLAASFASEGPEDRAWLLGALAERLTDEDAPLLEAALGDGRQDVRVAAATLLSRLPASPFAQRMRERALPLLWFEGRVRKRLHVDLPEECDEAMARDGIVRKAPQGTGQRAWWLEQLIAWTPLAAWEAIGLTPELAADLQAKDELDGPVLDGLARAAEAQADPRWAALFLDVHPGLVSCLSDEDRVALARKRMRNGTLALAREIPAPWPPALSQEGVPLVIARLDRGDWQAAHLIAQRLDPAAAGEVADRLPIYDPGATQRRHADEVVTVLFTRRDMYEELR